MMEKITVIGAGNVGHHLAQQLYKKGHQIIEVFSRTPSKAQALADRCNAQICNNLSNLSTESDIYILCIKDDGMKTLAEEISFLNKYDKIIAHTSGSVSSSVFKQHFEHYGVFYPLQTFSMQKAVDFDLLPFCIYGNNAMTQERLSLLAQSICPNVYEIDDEQRAILHVSAVMVNNFSNFLFTIADQLCSDHQVPFEILKPLIEETVQKIKNIAPKDAQTGPAKRGDMNTINKHISFLDDYPQYQQIYSLFSQAILDSK